MIQITRWVFLVLSSEEKHCDFLKKYLWMNTRKRITVPIYSERKVNKIVRIYTFEI